MPGTCGACVTLLISGSLYQTSLVLDVKVEILEVRLGRGAREAGRILVP